TGRKPLCVSTAANATASISRVFCKPTDDMLLISQERPAGIWQELSQADETCFSVTLKNDSLMSHHIVHRYIIPAISISYTQISNVGTPLAHPQSPARPLFKT